MGAAEPFVTLTDLAGEFGMDKSYCRKWAVAQGFVFRKRRVVSAGQRQMHAALSVDEAAGLRLRRSQMGFAVGGAAAAPVPPPEWGSFYVVALIPDVDGKRLKLGFADSVRARLEQHRTAAPTLELVRVWPCKRTWERAVIDALGAGCRHVGGEVFDCEDVPALTRKAEELFALLPASPASAKEGRSDNGE